MFLYLKNLIELSFELSVADLFYLLASIVLICKILKGVLSYVNKSNRLF